MRTNKENFLRLLKNPRIASHLTCDLYSHLHLGGNFIAHFDRNGFFRARFGTLAAFEATIDGIRRSPTLKHLLEDVSPELLAQASFRIAAAEAALLIAEANTKKAYAQTLQDRFHLSIHHELSVRGVRN